MSAIYSDTVRLPAGRRAADSRASADPSEEPVVLRFPGRSLAEGFDRAAVRASSLWIQGYRGKRSFDILVGGLMALALMPLTLLVASILFFLNRGHVLTRTLAAGRGGGEFSRLRFRTRGILRSAAPSADEEISAEPGAILPLFDLDTVPRTRFGRFLHATGLDRLPELWNVLRGDLALVGPGARIPDDPESLPEFSPRWDLTPGFAWVSPTEPEHDVIIRYVATQGIRTDLQILTLAGWRLLTGFFRTPASNHDA